MAEWPVVLQHWRVKWLEAFVFRKGRVRLRAGQWQREVPQDAFSTTALRNAAFRLIPK